MLEYFYHTMNQNITFSLSTYLQASDDSYTDIPAISSAAQFIIWDSASNVETITLMSFNYPIGSLWC